MLRVILTNILLAITLSGFHGLGNWIGAVQAEDAVTEFRDTLDAWQDGAVPTQETLQVVCFHPADLPPQKDYQARIQRIMLDIQSFYCDEMQRNGFGPVTFPLEMREQVLQIHTVTGREPAAAYNYRSGEVARREIREALADQFDLEQSFTMIFHGLCRKQADGQYVFFAPYYGASDSSQRYGLCHAADCELLDTKLLTETKRTIEYEEHTGRFIQHLADFNTKYIGGVAHELGHALGLPHNRQTDGEHSKLGTALMGAGNHTYRRERWSPDKGSFLTFASAARLASHPLFTRSDRGRFQPSGGRVADLHFDSDNRDLLVEGAIASSPKAYAVIAYADPDGGSDYDALTGVSAIKDGRFQLRVPCARKRKQQLRLVLCLANGAATPVFRSDFDLGPNGQPMTTVLNARSLASGPVQMFLAGNTEKAARVARQLLARADLSKEAAERLRHIIHLAGPRIAPVAATESDGDQVALSGLTWTEAHVGWGRPSRDHYYFAANVRDALLLETGDQFFASGLYAHAPSRYVFELGGAFKSFRSVGGLQSGAPSIGSAVFVIKGDGRELYRSSLIRGRDVASIDISVEDVDSLELIVETGKRDNACCWSIWGAPTVTR